MVDIAGDIADVYEEVRADGNDTDWLLLEYESDKKDALRLAGKGTGGITEFKQNLKEDQAGFGFIRVIVGNDELSRRSKFIFVTWCGPKVKVMRKAKLSVHIANVKTVLKSFSVEISASSLDDLVESEVITLVKKSMGANYDGQAVGGGRNFPGNRATKVYLQCRFNNEILTTDPEPHTASPVWDTELAWDIAAKPLGFLKSQRAKLKLVCYEIDAANRRAQVGYLMLDLRAASDAPARWSADPRVDRDAAWGWFPLINYAPRGGAAAPFRPEIRLGFCVVPKARPPQPQPAPRRPPRATEGEAQLPPHGRPPPQRRSGASTPAGGSRTHSPVPGGGELPVRRDVITASGLVVRATDDGYFQIGSGSDGDDFDWWVISVTIAFVENLSLVVDKTAADMVPTTTTGYYFYYSFLGVDVLAKSFPDLDNPSFPPERSVFRFRCSGEDMQTFLEDEDQLLLYLCRDGIILGFTEIHLSALCGAHPSPPPLQPSSQQQQQQQPLGSIATVEAGKPAVVERLYTLYDPQQEVPISVDAALPSVGVSLVLSRGDQPFERQSVEEQQLRAGLQMEQQRQQQRAGAFGLGGGGGGGLSDVGDEEETDSSQDEPVKLPSESAFAAKSGLPSVSWDIPERIVPEMDPLPQQQHQEQQQQQQQASSSKSDKIALPPHIKWQQFRFSIDIRSIRGFAAEEFSKDYESGLSIYIKYTYSPFGTNSPIISAPVAIPARLTPSTHSREILLPHSFCAFEFVMAKDRLETYLEGVPLVLEFWSKSRSEGGRGDRMVGTASIDMSKVLRAEPRHVGGKGKLAEDASAAVALDVGVAQPLAMQTAEVTAVAISAARPVADPDLRWERGSRALRSVGEVKVIFVLEDFGAVVEVDAKDLPAAQTAAESGAAGAAAAKPFEYRMEVPLSTAAAAAMSPSRRRAADSPTRRTERASSPVPGTIYRGHQEPAPPHGPPSSPSQAGSIHQTQEYQAALDLALWQRSEMQKFRDHLRKVEGDLLARLTREHEARDAARRAELAGKAAQLEELEKAARALAARLETREKAVERADEAVQRRREEVERDAARKDAETQDVARRLGEEFRARIEIERNKAAEADAARLRAVRERDEKEERLRRCEREMEEYRHAVALGKYAGFGGGGGSGGGGGGGGGSSHDAAAIEAVRAELKKVVEQAAQAEKRAATLDRAKKHYKAQWINALRDLARAKKGWQDELEQRLRTSNKELDAMRVRMMAKEEMLAMDSERSLLKDLRATLENIKAGAGGGGGGGVGDGAGGEARRADAAGPTAKSSGGGGGGVGAPGGGSSGRENVDPKILQEVERLARERDSLLSSRGYTREDRLIRELDARIGALWSHAS
ncbi:Cep120 protein-domain-containing protein [Zopfochytrium polystomum]|nr:Cep120 protein-domain-containing protein [Zopfochytrium polystomum]